MFWTGLLGGLASSTAATLALDFAQNIFVMGGQYNNITNTANTAAKIYLMPLGLGTPFTNNSGSATTLWVPDAALGGIRALSGQSLLWQAAVPALLGTADNQPILFIANNTTVAALTPFGVSGVLGFTGFAQVDLPAAVVAMEVHARALEKADEPAEASVISSTMLAAL